MVLKFYFLRWYIALTIILCNNVGFRTDQSICLVSEDVTNITVPKVIRVRDQVHNEADVLFRGERNTGKKRNDINKMPSVLATRQPNIKQGGNIIQRYFAKPHRSLEESELDLIGSGKLPEHSLKFENEVISVLTSVPSPVSTSSSSISSQFDSEESFVSSLENVTNTEAKHTPHDTVNIHSADNHPRHATDSRYMISSDASPRNMQSDYQHSHECHQTDTDVENPHAENISTADVAILDSNISGSLLPELTKDKHLEQEPSVQLSAEEQEDIPSFREWTEKHLAEEEKEENNTNILSSSVKRKTLKKNFASLDCGAKVVAANPEAKLAGSLLSPTKDEYLLSACNSRIWFVVELCEAVQVEMIELANFELFSSSPRDFSVSVSDRFPSRDWSTLGSFEAKDEKSVQSFHLHPTHFTKYIKVEVHSHYGQEHYCPISLFRVYGTSELEVLDHPGSENDNIDTDDDLADSVPASNVGEKDIFGSARDAVINIVRKAAEVLVNSPSQNIKSTADEQTTMIEENLRDIFSNNDRCITPRYNVICDNCDNSLFTSTFEYIRCDTKTLDSLLRINRIFQPLRSYPSLCSRFGIHFVTNEELVDDCSTTSIYNDPHRAYSLAFFSDAYLGALCNLMMIAEVNSSRRMFNLTREEQPPPTPHSMILNYTRLDRTVESMVHVDIHQRTVTTAAANIVASGFDDGTPTKMPASSSDAAATFKIVNTIATTSDGQIVSDQIKPTKTYSQRLHDNDSISKSDDNDSANISIVPIKMVQPTSVPILENNDTLVINNNKDSNMQVDHVNDLVAEDSTSIDTLISELERTEDDGGGHSSAPVINVATTINQKPQIQKESVFVRLANRIKTLERNMSLSGQYLEELSRRYKKQVEDMQRLLADVAEERQRNKERDERYVLEISTLVKQVAALTSTVETLVAERDSWSYKALMVGEHSIIVAVEVLLLIGIMVLCRGVPSVEISKRKISVEWSHVQNKKRLISTDNVGKNRRQSADNILSPQNDNKTHQRRPSEVAVGTDGTTHQELLITDVSSTSAATINTASTIAFKNENRRKRRRRKELASAVALNLEVGNSEEISSRQTNFKNSNQQSSMKRSHSEVFPSTNYDDRLLLPPPASNGNLASVVDSAKAGGSSTNSAAMGINFVSMYKDTASSIRRKRTQAALNKQQQNQKKSLESASPQHGSFRGSSSECDSSTPQTPVKDKRISGIKKVVKKFF